MSKEQELKLTNNKKKFDIREEYFVCQVLSLLWTVSDDAFSGMIQRLSAASNENWEPKRIARPKGLPEWGVPPTEPATKDGSK